MSYKHLFFDLDHTLWDHEANSRTVLRELYVEHELEGKNISQAEFLKVYKKINHHLWDLINKKEIDKDGLREKRFAMVLEQFELEDQPLSQKLEYEYIELCSRGTLLMPNAMETLEVLHKEFRLHIITNGFVESQNTKLKASGLGKYFEAIIIADEYKVYKPEPRIFEHALEETGASAEESIYIGDNPRVDVLGAHRAGWHSVYYNPDKVPGNGKETFEVEDLAELPELFGIERI